MPHPENDRGPWIYAFYRVLLSWPVLLLCLVLGVSGTPITVSAETATLDEVRVGNHGDYIRIVFELSSQVQHQLDEDSGANKISIQFLETTTTISKILETAQSSCLEEVTTSQLDDHVVAHLRFNPRWNKINPFTLREPDRMVLDVYCSEGVSTDRSQTDIQLDQESQVHDTTSEKKSEPADSASTLTNDKQVETETAPIVAKEPPVTESTTPSAVVTERRIQGSKPVTNQAAKPVATTKVAPQKKDPFQKYLLIMLAAITGIIIILIALIVIQKKSQSTGSDVVTGNAQANPDEAMHAIDKQIKAKLMKYDDQ